MMMRERQRHEQDVLFFAAAEGSDHAALDRVSEQEEERDDHRDGEIRIDSEEHVKKVDAVERQHQQATMGEVDDMQHAVDEGKSESDQSIDRPGRQATQNCGQYKRRHGPGLSVRGAADA